MHLPLVRYWGYLPQARFHILKGIRYLSPLEEPDARANSVELSSKAANQVPLDTGLPRRRQRLCHRAQAAVDGWVCADNGCVRLGSDSSVRVSRTSGPLKKPTTLEPVPGSLRAYDNDDLRKLREGQRDKISITALAAKRVYTGADIGAGVANTLRSARSTTAFEGAAVIMEIGRAPLSLSVTLMR